MKIVGYIEKVTHDLSPDIWRKMIDELPELERSHAEIEFSNLLQAFVVERNERIGEFVWCEDDDEIVVKGNLASLRPLAEHIATRIGGRFMPSL